MFKTLLTAVSTTALVAGLSLSTTAIGQEETDQRLGTVHFPTTCNETAQRRFDRAMRYQHSFWYRQSQEVFEDTLKADPDCAIAYWGIALALLLNPHNAPPPENLPRGLASLERGKAIGAKSQRERDFIDALLVLYTDHEKVARGPRLQAYLKAAEALAQRYPDDDEAQINYAITLNVSASPNDKTFAQQLKGAAILEPLFKRQPRHPGVAHYLIHLYDYPAIADKGLDAARRYSQIAPSAPHALHMPSHIFTRVGAWMDSIASNTASKNAARASREPGDAVHASDYMVYAFLQLGQDRKAREVVEELNATTGNPDAAGMSFGMAASPARYVMERGDWNGASELPVQVTRFAQVEAITLFARAIGAARTGKLNAVKADIAKLAELRDRLSAARDPYWAEQVDIQRQITSAWLLFAEGKHDAALNAMSAAANAEDRTEKSPVTPGPIVPARELYAGMLMERGFAREALAAFEATLKKEPNRLGATIGAALAAEKAGDAAKAQQHHAAVVALTDQAEPVRPEIAASRAYLAKAR
jgi:tetratricopeptide (TPR) repeat protein